MQSGMCLLLRRMWCMQECSGEQQQFLKQSYHPMGNETLTSAH